MASTKGEQEPPLQATGDDSNSIQCRLVHHGAAAESSSKVLTWLPPCNNDNNSWGRLVYASHAMINIARHKTVQQTTKEPLWNVTETLRTSHSYSTSPTEKPPVITALTTLRPLHAIATSSSIPTLVCGFSNGTLTIWNQHNTDNNNQWKEQLLVDGRKDKATEENACRSITDVSGLVWHDTVLVVSGSSAGVTCHSYKINTTTTTSHCMISHSTPSAVQIQALSDSTVLLLVGTAAPRHNKILIYRLTHHEDEATFCGALTGHEDWITCFAWQNLVATPRNFMLASGSQDFRIRLWKFMTTTTTTTTTTKQPLETKDTKSIHSDEQDDDDDDVEEKEEDDYEEHESRMEILWNDDDNHNHNETTALKTSVSLEALLLGHEEPVTAVHWYPDYKRNNNDNNDNNQDNDDNLVLLSSSMDRSILIWSPSHDDGIWTPMTRVGSAGGILGGSIGSTLLGYVNVQIVPSHNQHCLVGHAYGGALHVWHCNTTSNHNNWWKATPCVTGHFNGVTDLCWESTFGDYLLTVSIDQTCRLWAPVEEAHADADGQCCWVEVARPQVHGYDLTAITSLSSPQHRHWMVSGADEKELRILDAPMTTVRMLQAVHANANDNNSKQDMNDKGNNGVERVERAYIPSLGLSNKASAADGAEEDLIDQDNEHEDDDNDATTTSKAASQTVPDLPLERDLGAMSLWLEKRKLFGHNTELFCVTSTLEAKSAKNNSSDDGRTLVASAAKARDVEAAAIRIWDPLQSACLQTLSGGHKSTVATLSFSSDNGRYLASSGKDRRLCIWKQTTNPDSDGQLYSLAAAKDSAHKRIIWSVHFCPYDPTILASGSRDGNIKIWTLADNEEDGVTVTMDAVFSFAPTTLNPSQKPDSVTSLAIAPRPIRGTSNGLLLALGLECGLIELWSVPLPKQQDAASPDSAPTLLRCFPPNLCHVATVTQLAWRPLGKDNHDSQSLTLASCSMDHGCRIFEVND